MEIEGTCLEYLDLLCTQSFEPEVENRLLAVILTIFTRYNRHGDVRTERVDETDADGPCRGQPIAAALATLLASPEIGGGRGECAQLRGLPWS